MISQQRGREGGGVGSELKNRKSPYVMFYQFFRVITVNYGRAFQVAPQQVNFDFYSKNSYVNTEKLSLKNFKLKRGYPVSPKLSKTFIVQIMGYLKK